VGRLRRAILGGDMAPGQRLIEEELAGMLGVTRASLRAALFDLTAEGLVERIPNRGARVRVISIDEAVAITECRMALEGLCAAKAAERITELQAGQLRQLREELERSVAEGETLKYSALNHELHRLVREISGQAVAAALLERLNGQLVRHRFQLSLRPGRPQASLPEHLAIISAIAGRRPAEAEEATRRHLRSVIAALLDHQGLEHQGLEHQGLDTQGSDTRGPDTRGPDTRGPDTRGPDTRGPDTRGPDTRGPDTRGPDPRGPDTRGPDTQGL
jgi:DNA-binding GntR family transcriptional regulator